MRVGDGSDRSATAIDFAKVEDGMEGLERSFAERVFTGAAVVEEIGGRAEDGDGLESRRAAFDGVLGVRVGGFGVGSEEEGEVTAGGGSADSDEIGVDAVIVGVKTDETDCTFEVADDFGDGVSGAASVNDGEDGVASGCKLINEGDGVFRNVGMSGGPAAADDDDDPDTSRILMRREEVQRQGGPELSAIDDVLLSGAVGEFWRVGSEGLCGEEREEEGGEGEEGSHGGVPGGELLLGQFI